MEKLDKPPDGNSHCQSEQLERELIDVC